MTDQVKRSGRVATFCANCGKQICKQRNGAWYHRHNSSTACRFGGYSSSRAEPRYGEGSRKEPGSVGPPKPASAAVSTQEPGPARCEVDWGSATASQRCVSQAGHNGLHIDGHRHRWAS